MPKDGKYGNVTLERKPDAPADEPVFVLRAQDILAPFIVHAYADLVARTIPGPDAAQTASVIHRRALEMAEWRERTGRGKLPDGV